MSTVTYRLLQRPALRARVRGVTLIELMMVIIVVAILGSIAVSSYRSYLLRANRTEARMALLRVQAAQEKFFLQNNRYASNSQLATAPPAGLGIPTTTPKGFYTISIENWSDSTYTAVATAAGGQTKDVAACQRLTIDHTGARTPNEASGCWR
ncbi:MAG TPA: type IV pilin protein [Steroidobacteraceae bacterium]